MQSVLKSRLFYKIPFFRTAVVRTRVLEPNTLGDISQPHHKSGVFPPLTPVPVPARRRRPFPSIFPLGDRSRSRGRRRNILLRGRGGVCLLRWRRRVVGELPLRGGHRVAVAVVCAKGSVRRYMGVGEAGRKLDNQFTAEILTSPLPSHLNLTERVKQVQVLYNTLVWTFQFPPLELLKCACKFGVYM